MRKMFLKKKIRRQFFLTFPSLSVELKLVILIFTIIFRVPISLKASSSCLPTLLKLSRDGVEVDSPKIVDSFFLFFFFKFFLPALRKI